MKTWGCLGRRLIADHSSVAELKSVTSAAVSQDRAWSWAAAKGGLSSLLRLAFDALCSLMESLLILPFLSSWNPSFSNSWDCTNYCLQGAFIESLCRNMQLKRPENPLPGILRLLLPSKLSRIPYNKSWICSLIVRLLQANDTVCFFGNYGIKSVWNVISELHFTKPSAHVNLQHNIFS